MIRMRLAPLLGLVIGAIASSAMAPGAVAATITLAATTTVEDSGLLAPLTAAFEKASGDRLRTIVSATGAALKLGETGDADVVLVHDRRAEEAFVARGFGAFRRNVMASRFLLAGPGGDPAGLKGIGDPAAALARIAEAGALFVSRGDDSGTNRAELRLWRDTGIDPRAASGRWYLEAGSGMGATLNIASAANAYVLTEGATWLAFANKGDLITLVDNDDPRLFNPYGVILVNPKRFAGIEAEGGRRFIDWLTGAEGQALIAGFAIDGAHPFRPLALSQPAPAP